MLALIQRQVGQIIKSFGVLLLMRIAVLEYIQHGLVFILRIRHGSQCRTTVTIIKEAI
ncbi:hypothetical protein D3C71_2052180 [compost metagenome]